MEISENIKEFKRKIIASGNDIKTADTYGNSMTLFLVHYQEKYNSPLHLTFEDGENYIIHLVGKKLSASYINSFVASAKRFYGINGQPRKYAKLQYRNNPPKCPNILTVDEIKKMIFAPIYLKQQVVINLLYDGALRRSEFRNLKVEHISRDRKITIVNSKFGKSRVIVIPTRTIQLLRKYYAEFRPKLYLLEGEGGRPQYSEKSIENVVKDTARKCGIQTKVTPHILRHSKATHLLDNGASEGYVAEFLGHEEISTTHDFYHRLTVNAMQKMFDDIDDRIMNAA